MGGCTYIRGGIEGAVPRLGAVLGGGGVPRLG